MKRTIPIFLIAAFIIAVGGVALMAADYVGAAKCKMCHKVQHTSWLETKHAKAWDTLQASPDKAESCEKCHITGSKDFPGVQCEACHGPGSEYKSLSVMKDTAKSEAAGLKAKPDEATCKTCHNEESPNFKPFNFEERVDKVHEHKAK